MAPTKHLILEILTDTVLNKADISIVNITATPTTTTADITLNKSRKVK